MEKGEAGSGSVAGRGGLSTTHYDRRSLYFLSALYLFSVAGAWLFSYVI